MGQVFKLQQKKRLFLFLIAQPMLNLFCLFFETSISPRKPAWQRLDSPKSMSTIYTTSQIPGEKQPGESLSQQPVGQKHPEKIIPTKK